MPTMTNDGSSRDDQRRIAADISTAVVHVFFDHTGRGPTRARTTIDGETVVVILHDGLTKAEQTLVDAGRHAEVLELRRIFQETMRDDLVAVVERLTACGVRAFMSANHVEPDAAAEVFLLDSKIAER
jgi:uncharacterized protein YbcI